jgi:hypothetical protein
MLYQLPNGKVVNISVEEYLNLTDEDIQALVALNFGEYATSYWFGSCINQTEAPDKLMQDANMLSFEEQDEYLENLSNFDINNIPDEEIDHLDLD